MKQKTITTIPSMLPPAEILIMGIPASRVMDFEQGTPEWFAARAGKATASRIKDILAKVKTGGESKDRSKYRDQLVAEILTGMPQESGFKNAAMQWGTDTEAEARGHHEAVTGQLVTQTGMVLHPTITRGGASPDGIMYGGRGLLEIKCPMTSTHLAWIERGKAPAEHQPQMLWQMDCCGPQVEWCDFISYDPRLPSNLQYFCVRFMRDQDRITEIQGEVQQFLAEVEAKVAWFQKWTGAA